MRLLNPRFSNGYRILFEGLNNPTNGWFPGIGWAVASEIIEPPRQARPYMYSEGAVPERLNNPTSARQKGSVSSLVGEIIEPPRDKCGYRRTIRGAHNPTRWRNRCGSRVFIDQRVRDCQAASRTSPVSSARSAFAAIQRSFKISFLTTRSDAACRRPSLHSGRSAS